MAVAPELERIPCFAFSRYRMERELSLSSVKRSSSMAPSFASAMELLVVPKSIPRRGVGGTKGWSGSPVGVSRGRYSWPFSIDENGTAIHHPRHCDRRTALL